MEPEHQVMSKSDLTKNKKAVHTVAVEVHARHDDGRVRDAADEESETFDTTGSSRELPLRTAPAKEKRGAAGPDSEVSDATAFENRQKRMRYYSVFRGPRRK